MLLLQSYLYAHSQQDLKWGHYQHRSSACVLTSVQTGKKNNVIASTELQQYQRYGKFFGCTAHCDISVYVLCVVAGVTKSGLFPKSDKSKPVAIAVDVMQKMWGQPEERGASPIIYAAASPDVEGTVHVKGTKILCEFVFSYEMMSMGECLVAEIWQASCVSGRLLLWVEVMDKSEFWTFISSTTGRNSSFK